MLAALLLEDVIRPLLVLHLVLAGALVAATTHHVVWSARYLWGNFGRRRGERTLALVAAVLYVATFALGNLLYPTYKVRVRAEYFDDSVAASADARLRETAEHTRTTIDPPPGEQRIVSLAWLGHLFDVKEHWVALGLPLVLALLWMSRRLDLKENRAAVPIFVGMSALVAALVWAGAIIGIVVTSYRSVGGL